MKAVFIQQNGGPEILTYGEAETPRPRLGEVLVKLDYASVNHVDIWVRRGLGGYKTEFPHVLGADGAGRIAELGPGVQGLREGTEVVLYPLLVDRTCRFCLAGREDQCVNRKLLGNQVNGTYAQYVAVPAYNAIPLDGLDVITAAATPVTFMTAWHALLNRAQLRPGETTLIWGASGGLGSAAVQIAKLAGAKVIATAGNEEKAEFVANLGADAVINYSKEDVINRVMEITGGQGVDVVFENVGTSTWEKSVRCLSPTGRLVTPGATTGKDANLDIRDLYSRQITLLGSYGGRKTDLLAALAAIKAGKIKPAVRDVLPLSDARIAHEKMEKGELMGKIVLKIDRRPQRKEEAGQGKEILSPFLELISFPVAVAVIALFGRTPTSSVLELFLSI
ncbi:MAG: zinc-binding dehydrogenase [Candidatus Marsarchaeota archaeon]